jgi:hypothetical protein
LALLFKQLATLRTDAPLIAKVGDLKWIGPTAKFTDWAEQLGPKVIARSIEAAETRRG